jgi:tetratricopeptide (TPR) repeat protein
MAGRLLFTLALASIVALPAGAAEEVGVLKSREASAALSRGNVDQALTLYNEALDDKTLPNDRRATILNDRGVAYARKQQHKEAIEDFNRAIQLYPEYPATYNNRGNVLLSLGVVREAMKDFDRALVLAPGYAAAYTNRAGAHMRMGQLDRAVADYTKAIELAPANAAALSGRGRAHLAAFRPHGAIRDFTRAVSVDSRFSAGYRSRAEAKLAIERYDEAIEDFSRAVAFEPRNADIYALRGQAYLEADNAASALKDFSKAIELSPNSAAYYATRGLAYAKAEAYEEALNDFARAIELEPRSARTYAYRAWAYRQQQQPELALKDVERALKLDGNSAEAHWARGEVHEATGKAELAVADLRKALSLDANLKDASRALERLGVSMRSDEPEVPDAGRDRWRVFQQGRSYVATNEEFPRLKVNLEMMGRGQPRILEWDVKKPPFAGIAVLRFYAGSTDGPRGAEEIEHAAIIDLQTSSVVSVEVQRLGAKTAQWTWDEGKLVVASADGITDEFQLRAKPKEAPPPPKRVAGDTPKTAPFWAPWGYDSRGRKPKTLFDLLFNN